jgi:hypothetical protein
LKVRELVSILGQLSGDGEIAMERSRLSDTPGVIEIELYEVGIKKLVEHDSLSPFPRESYWLYATTKASPHISPPAESPISTAATDSPFSRKQPVMEERTLVAAGVDDRGEE